MRWIPFAYELYNEWQISKEIKERFNIYNLIKDYEDELDDWDALLYVPNFTDNLERDSGYKLLCLGLCQGDLKKAKEYYEEWNISELYEWSSYETARTFRIPKRR